MYLHLPATKYGIPTPEPSVVADLRLWEKKARKKVSLSVCARSRHQVSLPRITALLSGNLEKRDPLKCVHVPAIKYVTPTP